MLWEVKFVDNEKDLPYPIQYSIWDTRTREQHPSPHELISHAPNHSGLEANTKEKQE